MWEHWSLINKTFKIMEEVNFYLDAAEESMKKTVAHTEGEFTKIRAGKANPGMLSGIMVEYYGAPTPLQQVSTVNSLDARTLVIKPWEKALLPEIEKAIINSDLGLNPQNDGEVIRLNIPALTEERRRELVKQVKAIAETGKVALRNIRKDTNQELKNLIKEGASEDLIKGSEDDVQKLTDQYSKAIDDKFEVKEEEIMTV